MPNFCRRSYLRDFHSQTTVKTQEPKSEFQKIQALARLLQNSKDFATVSIFHHAIVHSGCSGNRFIANLLLEYYGKFGSTADAFSIFDDLYRKNIFTWNIAISVLVQQHCYALAIQYFHQMVVSGIMPDKFTFSTAIDACSLMENLAVAAPVHIMAIHTGIDRHVVVATALMNMYSKHNHLSQVKNAFDSVTEHDTVSWSAMIDVYAKHGYEKLSVQLFQQMQRECMKPDPVALLAVLGACATLSTMTWGMIFHSIVIESGFESDLSVANALLNMYAKCGNLEDGLFVFAKMSARDVISWTAMISVYAHIGHVREALQLFSAMHQDCVRPNEITYVNILSACSHEGMFEEGLYCFGSLVRDCCIRQNLPHYGCIIDLYGRAGRLEEAERFLCSTQACNSPLMWHTLLGACKLHKDVERGKRAAECIIQLDPLISSTYVTLSDFYVTC